MPSPTRRVEGLRPMQDWEGCVRHHGPKEVANSRRRRGNDLRAGQRDLGAVINDRCFATGFRLLQAKRRSKPRAKPQLDACAHRKYSKTRKTCTVQSENEPPIMEMSRSSSLSLESAESRGWLATAENSDRTPPRKSTGLAFARAKHGFEGIPDSRHPASPPIDLVSAVPRSRHLCGPMRGASMTTIVSPWLHI
jgi:hypothetical protein